MALLQLVLQLAACFRTTGLCCSWAWDCVIRHGTMLMVGGVVVMSIWGHEEKRQITPGMKQDKTYALRRVDISRVLCIFIQLR